MDEPAGSQRADGDATTDAASPHPRDLVEVRPGVWVATATIWTTTSTVVVAPGGEALVVDPAVTVEEVEALAAAVHGQGWRVTAGFATHPHWDHVLWSRSLGDAPRYATARGADAARSRGTDLVAAADAAAPGHDPALVGALTPLPRGARRLPWPTGRTADGGPAAQADEQPREPAGAVVVEHDAHAPGHAALVVHGVLLAGDMLSDVEVPLVDTGSRDPVRTYRGALDALELAARDVDALVPGHGSPAVGRAAVAARFAADRAYLDALEHAVTHTDAVVADDRLTGYVATWHDEQLAALRAR
jgi:hydroxyacylglutathione hydrolase